MKRRNLLISSLGLPLTPALLGGLSGCSSGENPYFQGNFGPVAGETTHTGLAVSGEIPADLEGRFLRNGPNPAGEDPAGEHWFIGRGMVHGVRLRGGQAEWYRSRYVGGSAANTNVIGHAGRTLAIVESGGLPHDMSYNLDSVGDNTGIGGFSAHPKYDPQTGELHAMCYDWANLRDHVRYVVIDEDGELAEEAKIPLPGMPMIHDMSITENYAVIYDLPVTLSFLALGTGASFPFRWNDDYEPRVGLLPRGGAPEDIIWRSITPNYAYHPMNAYEDERGDVVIDIARYPRMFDTDTLGPFGDGSPRLDRWTLNPREEPGAGSVREETIDERYQEFPRCHPALNGQPYRYGYTVAAEGYSFPALYKHDLQTGSSWTYEVGAGRHSGEPVFVPREGASEEDDGYLLTFVFDQASGTSDLIIVDAQELTQLAAVHIPERVPYGFHGNWVPDTLVAPA
ncbi:MAG: carotenoid oxygenase family protein [Pseudomonadota bacterium]